MPTIRALEMWMIALNVFSMVASVLFAFKHLHS
jgi:hypothetical protein